MQDKSRPKTDGTGAIAFGAGVECLAEHGVIVRTDFRIAAFAFHVTHIVSRPDYPELLLACPAYLVFPPSFMCERIVVLDNKLFFAVRATPRPRHRT